MLGATLVFDQSARGAWKDGAVFMAVPKILREMLALSGFTFEEKADGGLTVFVGEYPPGLLPREGLI
ncbi:hypothetical protein [Roseateles sp. P5_E4]